MKKLLIIGAILGSIMSEHNVTVAMNQEEVALTPEIQREVNRLRAELLETQVEIVALERLSVELAIASQEIRDALLREVRGQYVPDLERLPGGFMNLRRQIGTLDSRVRWYRQGIMTAYRFTTVEELHNEMDASLTRAQVDRNVYRNIANYLTGRPIDDPFNAISELYETNDPYYQTIYNASPLTPPRRNTPVQTYEHLYVDA